MLKNTDFSQFYTELSDSITGATKVSLVTSLMINLMLSGPMYFLWGLVNSLQIVTHFPLISVMMPSNAYHLLLMIVEISDFQLIPVEETIEHMEDRLGIHNDGIALSDNFIDFELDSTDMIRNLQIIFLFLLGLLIVPIAFPVLFAALFWSKRCQRWL